MEFFIQYIWNDINKKRSCSFGKYQFYKIIEKLGFKNEGIYRDKHLFRGKYYDHYSFSLSKRDWNQFKVNSTIRLTIPLVCE